MHTVFLTSNMILCLSQIITPQNVNFNGKLIQYILIVHRNSGCHMFRETHIATASDSHSHNSITPSLGLQYYASAITRAG